MFEILGSELKFLDRKYRGVIIQQSKNVPSVFVEFFGRVKPSRILEIGSSFGGLSMLMEDILEELDIECEIISVDVKNRGQTNKKTRFIIENIFNEDYSLKSEEYSRFIQQEGISVVICDGGNKVKEFNELCNFLKDEDFIMAHDYAESRKFFIEEIKGKKWNGLEITEKGISDCSKRNNLQHFMKDEMANIAWVCKQKHPKNLQ